MGCETEEPPRYQKTHQKTFKTHSITYTVFHLDLRTANIKRSGLVQIIQIWSDVASPYYRQQNIMKKKQIPKKTPDQMQWVHPFLGGQCFVLIPNAKQTTLITDNLPFSYTGSIKGYGFIPETKQRHNGVIKTCFEKSNQTLVDYRYMHIMHIHIKHKYV